MQIRIFSTLREVTGGVKSIELEVGEPANVRAVLRRLDGMYPGLHQKLWDGEGRLAGGVQVMVNGRHVEFLQGPDTPVSQADTLSLFPPVGGG